MYPKLATTGTILTAPFLSNQNPPWPAEQSWVFLTCPLPLTLAGKQEWDEGSCFLPFAGTCPRQILVICRINRLPLSLCPAAETSSHFTAGVVVSLVGVPGRGLPGGHNCLLQFQWKYRAGRLKTPFQDNIHIFSCRYLNCCSPVGASCYHLPNSQCPSTMEDPTELGCSRLLCSCSG